jgi:NADH dehydrogenase
MQRLAAAIAEGASMPNRPTDDPDTHANWPHVLILGGGFGGLAVGRRLGGARGGVWLVDRRKQQQLQPQE